MNSPPPSLALVARRLWHCRRFISQRRSFAKILGVALGGHTHLDMVLDLYVAELEARQLCQSAVESRASRASAHRHCGTLVETGIIVREADPKDLRRKNVRLSDPIRFALDAFMDELAKG